MQHGVADHPIKTLFWKWDRFECRFLKILRRKREARRKFSDLRNHSLVDIDRKDIKAVSVNYGTNGYVWALAKIESDDGSFQFLTQTIGGTNHVQAFQDFTDFNILVPGTASELKKFPSGSAPSTITTAAQAKTVVTALLQQHNFDFQTYLNPPVAVPYTACPNFGLWEVRYLRKNATSNHEFIGFVVDGTGSTGPYFRLVEQSSTWSLPFTLQK